MSHVRLWNRGDCCGDRLKNFGVSVCVDRGCTDGAKQCGRKRKRHSLMQGTDMRVPCADARGRHVRIDVRGKDRILTLCEVCRCRPAVSPCAVGGSKCLRRLGLDRLAAAVAAGARSFGCMALSVFDAQHNTVRGCCWQIAFGWLAHSSASLHVLASSEGPAKMLVSKKAGLGLGTSLGPGIQQPGWALAYNSRVGP